VIRTQNARLRMPNGAIVRKRARFDVAPSLAPGRRRVLGTRQPAIAYRTDDGVYRAGLDGGLPVAIARLSANVNAAFGAWSAKGVIAMFISGQPLHRIVPETNSLEPSRRSTRPTAKARRRLLCLRRTGITTSIFRFASPRMSALP
jgi:hypothetical protein